MSKRWTKDLLISEFRDYASAGNDIRATVVQRQRLDLYKGACRHFGNYKTFITELGYDYESFHRRKEWDTDRVLSEFNDFESSGESLSYKNIRFKRNDLVIQIIRRFGSYKKFLEDRGYDYESVQGFKRWNRERVKKEIFERISEGKSLRQRDMELDCNPLLKAMIRYYGSHSSALLVCGLNPEETLGFTWWDEEKVKSEFLKTYHDPNITGIEELRKFSRGLDHAVRKHFGSYDNLCAELKLDVRAIRKEVYEWSADDLLRVLQTMKEQGLPLNIKSVETKFPSAWKVANRHFGGFANALSAIGESYEIHVENHLYTSFAGHVFESLVKEAFLALNKMYLYKYRGIIGIVPDFYNPSENEIIDVKLSSWSVFNCKTIENYTPYCEKLTVVYLRGGIVDHKVSKLTLRSIEEYYDALKAIDRNDIVSKIEELRVAISKKATEDAV